MSEQAALDWWIIKQLRSMVLTDLREFVPEEYFAGETETFRFNEGIANAAHYSSEMRWGSLAGKLGQKLIYHSTVIMTARQTSAADVLMNLGLLAATEAAQGVSHQLSLAAKAKDVSDENAGPVAEQLRTTNIPTLVSNVRGALTQYLRYLTTFEAEPFLPLLEVSTQKKVSMKSPDQPAGQPTFNFYGNVGAIQTAPNAVAHVRQQGGERDFSVLVDALMQLRNAVSAAEGIDANQRVKLVADIAAFDAEIKRGVEDETTLLKWLAGIGSIVQTLGSAQPAWEVLRAAARSVGLPL